MINPSCQFDNVILDRDGAEIYNEAEYMYDIAVKVQRVLEEDGRVEAYISRSSRDERTNLRSETRLARRLDCDLLIALHSDYNDTPGDPGGTWSFYADEEGKRLAELVQSNVLASVRTFHPEVNFRGVRTHWKRLWVLHNSGCPAALIEILFHSHPKEREMLKDPEKQEIIARAIAKGLLEYLLPEENNSPG